MKTKLTLSIEKEVIEEAKLLAKAEGTNLSTMVEGFLQLLINQQNQVAAVKEAELEYGKKLKPEVLKKLRSLKKLEGLLKHGRQDKSYEDLKLEYFKEKYDL